MFTNGGKFARRWLGDYRQAEQRSHELIQDEMHEHFVLTPKVVKPNHRPVTSEAPRLYFRGTFSWVEAKQPLQHQETDVLSRVPKIDILRYELAYLPKRGDEILRLSTGDCFEVSAFMRDGYSGACIKLLQLGRNS